MKIRVVLSLLVSVVSLYGRSGEPAPPPNILYILADDLGYGDLSAYGQQRFQTPNLDRLAAEGIRFTQHYAGSTVCAPSRCSLLTGKHTGHARIRGNGAHELLPEDVTVFECLKQAGYRTAMIGKSGLSGDTEDGGQPNTQGVDHFFGFVNHQKAHHYFPPELYRDGELVPYPENRQHEGTDYTGDLFFEDVIAFLEEEHDAPFFLHYAPQIPHASLYAQEEWKARFRGQFEETPLTGQRHYRNEPEPKTTFVAMIARLDWEVGQIMAKLRELGLDDTTVVLFASDNGPTTVAGYDVDYFDSNGPWRGAKRDLTEGGLRIPFLARWPGHIAPGSQTAHVSAFWDFLPTACDLAGVIPPGDTDGISFLPTLLGRGTQRTHDALYWEFPAWGGKRAVLLDGRWKGIQTDLLNEQPSTVALYDLQADPGEERDVAEAHPDILQRVKDTLRAAHTPNPWFPWPENPDR